MAQFAYIRVSSEKQAYDRQLFQLNEYFNRCGINTSKVRFIEEKITSYTSFRQRAIYPILRDAKEGDIIYACQVDRFGRTVDDLIQLVEYADAKGIELQALKESMRVTRKTPIGKMILTMMATAAEMERDNFAERRRYGIKAAQDEIKKNGIRISHISGKEQTRWGNAKGTDETKRIMAIAREASAAAKQDAAILWREQSQAVMFVHRKKAEGWTIQQITNELGHLFDENIPADSEEKNPYATPNGCKPTKGTVSKWCREMNPLAV